MFYCENAQFLWPFSIAMFNYQKVNRVNSLFLLVKATETNGTKLAFLRGKLREGQS